MDTLLHSYEPKHDIQGYQRAEKLLKIYILEEVFIHYCINNDIDLREGMHEPYMYWVPEIEALMYFDMKIHETLEEYEHCLILQHAIKNSITLYQQVKKRFLI